MRVVVTGAGNPYGKAIVKELLSKGHQVRVFGGSPEDVQDLDGARWHPGSLTTLGSIEPVLAEREVLIHTANLDAPGKDKDAFARHIEKGTLSCRYGAEREILDQFILVHPAGPGRTYAQVQQAAVDTVQASRKVHTMTIAAQGDADATAKEVVASMEAGPHLGRYPGRETDAVAP